LQHTAPVGAQVSLKGGDQRAADAAAVQGRLDREQVDLRCFGEVTRGQQHADRVSVANRSILARPRKVSRQLAGGLDVFCVGGWYAKPVRQRPKQPLDGGWVLLPAGDSPACVHACTIPAWRRGRAWARYRNSLRNPRRARSMRRSMEDPKMSAARPESATSLAALRQEFSEGLRWLRQHSDIRNVTIAAGVIAAMDAAWIAVLVLYVIHILHQKPGVYGLLLAVGAVGGIAVGGLGPPITRRLGPWRSLLIAGLAMAASQAVLGLTANVIVAATMLAASSAAWALFAMTAVTMRQRQTRQPAGPDHRPLPHRLSRFRSTRRARRRRDRRRGRNPGHHAHRGYPDRRHRDPARVAPPGRGGATLTPPWRSYVMMATSDGRASVRLAVVLPPVL
jgi:hypothetical protein